MEELKKNLVGVGVFSGKGGLINLTALHPEIRRIITNDMYCTQAVYDAMLWASALGGEDDGAYPWDVANMLWAAFYESQTGKCALEAFRWLDKNPSNSKTRVISIGGVALPLSTSAPIYIFFSLCMPLWAAISYEFCASCQLDPVTGSWFWVVDFV